MVCGVLLRFVVRVERIKVRLRVAGVRVEPPAGLRRVILQRFGERPEVHLAQIEHRYLLHPLDGILMVAQAA